ncbi:type I restriction enzyme R subunit [Terracoccus luteus]|uniref:Type I restriction enzyme R subunit n=1 Tax=Terracoccus luteus TaxID=53356 RepID=A0A495Y2G1_9MICO|nr:type I restriction endonuclease [Terracoccus luteus]RKT79216.1 type I restriction enzyme R subunit [Terracoccus luteus]
MKAHRESAFEEWIEQQLAKVAWLKGDPAAYNRSLGLSERELMAFVRASQPEKWERLVSLHGSEIVAEQKLVRRVADELSARGTVDVLRRGVKDMGVNVDLAYFAPAHGLTSELQEAYDANRLTLVRQLHHSESNPAASLDLVLFVNGVPTATAEIKTHTAGQRVEDAIRQYRTDRNPTDLIFRARTVVHFAVDQDEVYMTTRLQGPDTVFLPFNMGSTPGSPDCGKGNPLNPHGHRTGYLWEHVWTRETWLDLLGSYVHVEHVRDEAGKKTGQTRTIFPRYHQWDAVSKLLAAAREQGPGHNKLVQHSAGSGKSNTIAWLAHRLSRLHTAVDDAGLGEGARAAGLGPNEPVFDKVVIITDRTVLDRQLQDTVASFDHTPGMIVKIDKDSRQLRDALEGKQARIIITTLQKFPVVAESANTVAGTRFAVIADEAHSSQTGDAAKDLKAVLTGQTRAEIEAEDEQEVDGQDLLVASVEARGKQKNLTFFAFTATPKEKTLGLFGERVIDSAGEPRWAPFHLYSMRQAIEEGFILDMLANYTTYATYYRLANGLGLDDDPELPKGRAASALARWVSLHPSNIKQRAEIIVEHFRHHTASRIGGRAKAMVVTPSRIHAVRYHRAISEYIREKGYDRGDGALRALVAFSGTLTDPDNPTVVCRESAINGFSESQLPERFGGPEYQVLVVAEKYQTGFDQPLLHTMYVAKKLAGVNAVQTLSRLNRTHAGKEDTFVLDFVNRGEEIREAFQPWFTETTATPADPNLLYNLQRRILDASIIDSAEMAAAVDAVLRGGPAANATLNRYTDPAVARWHDLDEDDREGFRTAVRDFVRAYAYLAQIVPFRDPELEQLYYHGKYLITRLPRTDSSGSVDLGDAVVLTHLRTELLAEQEVLSLTEGSDEPLPGHLGEGRGKQHEEPMDRLSELINALNERFGMDLGEGDRIWFEQQQAALAEDEDVRLVALNNDFRQFEVYLEPKVQEKVVQRHEANDSLFQAFFDKPEFKEQMLRWIGRALYDGIRDDRTG